MSKDFWAVIEELDEFEVVVAMHIMPVKEVLNTFPTKTECEAFVAELDRQGNPCIMDGEGANERMLVYYGHTLSKHCHCRPELRGGLNPSYVHKHNQ